MKKDWDCLTKEELKKCVNYWENIRGCRVSWTMNAVNITGIPKELFLSTKIDEEALDEYLKSDAKKMKEIFEILLKAGYSRDEVGSLFNTWYYKCCEEKESD